jgi:general secretion pathway protein J
MRRNKVRSAKPVRRGRHSAGFTLIEILVAIAIFTMLSFSAYQVLNQAQRTNAQSIEFTERLKQLQRSLVIMDNDFRQMATRRFRLEGEEASTRLLWWGEGLLASEDNAVLFTRLGWQNPQGLFPRGEVVKVGYRIHSEVLERVWWRYPDTPAAQQAVVTPLLDGVEAMSMRFYREGNWSSSWEQENALPQAVELTLTLKDYGKLIRVYLTGGGNLSQVGAEEASNG